MLICTSVDVCEVKKIFGCWKARLCSSNSMVNPWSVNWSWGCIPSYRAMVVTGYHSRLAVSRVFRILLEICDNLLIFICM
jgi:hypothetical protein